MTRNAKWTTVGALLSVACLGAASRADAACTARTSIQTFQNQRPPESYTYIDPASGTDAIVDPPGLLGRFWELGARASFNEGTLPPSAWLYNTKNGVNVEARLDSPAVVGCPTPTGTTATLVEAVVSRPQVQTIEPKFAIMTAQGIPANAVAFDLAKLNQNLLMFTIPPPLLAPNGSSPTSIPLLVTFSPINQGIYGGAGASAVKAYQIVRTVGTAGGFESTGWSLVSEYPTSGGQLNGQPLTIDCTGISGQRVYVATRIRFDSSVVGQLVSSAVLAGTCP